MKDNIKIFNLEMINGSLNIGLRVRGDYDVAVRNPRIILKFDNGSETRRLPLLIKSYFPNNDFKTFTIFATYSYKLDYIFFNENNGDIKISIEFFYGNREDDDISLKLSSDIEIVGDEDYNLAVSDDEKHIIVKPLYKNRRALSNNPIVVLCRGLIAFIWQILLYALGIVLLPVFMVEGLLAMAGILNDAPRNKNDGILRYIYFVRWRINFIVRKYLGFGDIKNKMAAIGYFFGSLLPVSKNRVSFISNRRNDLTGNFVYIYEYIKDDNRVKIIKILDERERYFTCLKYGYNMARSKVCLVDDFVKPIYSLKRRSGTYLIQVWHACGAFKTFGFSRLGKSGGQKQTSMAHRNYDYCTVSSSNIRKFYTEGFGLSDEKAVATGVPRTDIFFDEKYKNTVKEQIYTSYPILKDKKIILFAPTFRGNGKKTGFYPDDRFNPMDVLDSLGDDYIIIIKHHPFVNNRITIPDSYKDRIIDLSDNSELNDLLFVTDILITDYSSVIFEASLLDIPMIFYAFDLQQYISSRGFYYEFEDFVPGKIVNNINKLINSIKEADFDTYKIDEFKKKFFDDLDGKSSERVANLIVSLLDK